MLGFRTKEVIVAEDDGPSSIEAIRQVLGIPGTRSVGFVESIPFVLYDATAGSETELQAAVSGSKECVDLPIVIESSNYFANIMRRAAVGTLPSRLSRISKSILPRIPKAYGRIAGSGFR